MPNLLVHGVRSVTGDVIGSRCYRVPRKFEGVTLAVEPRPFPSRLEEMCREFAGLAGITGCYHLEFMKRENDRLGGVALRRSARA